MECLPPSRLAPERFSLRRISIHLWALSHIFKASVSFLSKLPTATNPDLRSRLNTELVRVLLEVGETLAAQQPRGAPGGWRRSVWLYLRASYFSWIVSFIAAVANEWSAGLSDDELKRVIRLGELALEYGQSAGEKLFEAQGWQARLMPRAQKKLLRMRKAGSRATLHYMLATAYLRLNVGDIARNCDTAFRHYESAAHVLESAKVPLLSFMAAGVWATLGTALLHYPTENRRVHAERAEEALNKANEIFASYDPADFRRTDTILRAPSLGTPSVSAVARFSFGKLKTALTATPDPEVVGVFSPLFRMWVMGQLGVVYRELGEFQKACESFDLALQESVEGSDDELRTTIELNKGFTYLESTSGDPQKNLSIAAKSISHALRLSRKSVSVKPYARAIVADARACFAMEALGTIATDRRAKLFETVSRELREAAKLTRAAGVHVLLQEALWLLGKSYFLQSDIPKAYRALVAAARVSDRMGKRVRTLRLSRYRVSCETPLYELLVPIALKYAVALTATSVKYGLVLNSALTFAERGRTNLLRSELAGRILPRGARPADVERLFSLRRAYQQSELRLFEQESIANTSRKDGSETLKIKRNDYERQYLDELERVRATFGIGTYDPDLPIAAVNYHNIHDTVCALSREEGTALVEYYISDQGLLVFVVLPTEFNCVRIKMTRNELESIRVLWESGLHIAGRVHPTHWENGYLQHVLEGLEVAAYYPVEVIKDWEREEGRTVRRVILIPHRFLHLLPFHAIPIAEGKRWGDTVSIHYVPSGAILRRLARRRSTAASEVDKTVAIAYSVPVDGSLNSEQPLLFHREEILAVEQIMQAEVLQGEKATPKRVKEIVSQATHIHISCHGMFESTNPLDSALVLAPDGAHGKLTLGEIFESIRLPRTRLVVLSACETGITKAEWFHDEYIGLPAGFLYAGAKTVVSTLWRVPDVASWILMRTFWKEIKNGTRPGEALRRASCALRSVSLDEARELITAAASREEDPLHRQSMLEERDKLREEHPFSSPYWWAGFTVNGLG